MIIECPKASESQSRVLPISCHTSFFKFFLAKYPSRLLAKTFLLTQKGKVLIRSMVKPCICALLLASILLWPIHFSETTSEFDFLRKPLRIEAAAEVAYLKELSRRGVNLKDQGVRVESLDGSLIYADHHSDRLFNPASVIKIATSLLALERFGPEHQFRTHFYVDGNIDKSGVLDGDLILSSDGDPVMSTRDLIRLARQLTRKGLRRIKGRLIIAGPFTVGNLYSERWVKPHLARTLRRIGLRVPTKVEFGERRGYLMAERISDPLHKILFYQNAHSNNPTADRLGVSLGGPAAVEHYLQKEIGIPLNQVQVARTSGLEDNRMTPHGTVMLLRRMFRWLEKNRMSPEDLLPVAGIDRGTLRMRFRTHAHRGALVAKTGTLVATDDGISTLAGVLYTKDHGPMLFAIFNTHGPVLQYRKFQDRFLKKLLAEYGGIPPINGLSTRLAE